MIEGTTEAIDSVNVTLVFKIFLVTIYFLVCVGVHVYE